MIESATTSCGFSPAAIINKAAGTRKNAVEPEVASNIDILFLYPIVIFKTLSFITIIEV